MTIQPAPVVPTLGLIVSTIGRSAVRELLRSAAAADAPPEVVAIANQSGRPLPADWLPERLPFEVRQVGSSGGVSRGRNDAFVLLAEDVDVVGTPNDDAAFAPDTFARVRAHFAADPSPDAVAGTVIRGDGPSRGLPPAGTALDRRTVWRAGEPALFLRARTVAELGGFAPELGVGGPTRWQSGEGTDLLLRLLGAGGRVISAPAVQVRCPAERRDLTDREWVRKNRSYARGTGYVYRQHGYPLTHRLGIVAMPWLRAVTTPGPAGYRVRLACARSLGRVEGLLGWTPPTSPYRR